MAKARRWQDVRTKAIQRGVVTEEGIADAHRYQDTRIRAYRLAQLRERAAINQTELAERMHTDQSRVSRIENGDLAHTELATLHAYIEALGGHLRITADFGDETLTITDKQ